MAYAEDSWFAKDIDPKWQAVIAVCLIPCMTFLFWLPSALGAFTLPVYFAWTVAAAITLLYASLSSILSLSSKDPVRYWGRSISGYAAVVVLGGFFAYAMTGLSIYEAMSFSWIYVVFTFVYLVFLSIVSAIRKIVDIAQRQDRRMRGEE